MAWSAPATAVSGQTITAAFWNTNGRDNLNVLASGAAYQQLRMNSGATAPEYYTPPAAHVTHSIAQDVLNTTWTVLNFDTTTFDNASMHSNVTNNTRITLPIPGIYLMIGRCGFVQNTTGTRHIGAKLNGVDFGVFEARVGTPTGLETVLHFAFLRSLAANDYLELRVYQDSGVTLQTVSSNTWKSPSMLVVLVSKL